MKALFISSLDFESPIQVGDHQLAKQFANHGWELAFISLVVTPFHVLSKNKNAVMRKLRNYINGGYSYSIGDGNLWSYVPGGFISPKIFTVSNLNFTNTWHKLTTPNIKKILISKGFGKVDLLYIRDPYQLSILNLIDYDFSIYRIADNDENFSSSHVDFLSLEKSLTSKTNLVLYTARNLKEKVIQLNPENYSYFPNGVDFKHFEADKYSIPEEYKKIDKPIVVYAGSFDFWFDYDLINELALSLPDVAFVLIGPNEKYHHKFLEASNLYLLGPIPHKIIPKFLIHADLGIIPFNVIDYPDLVNSINPIKLYEYMASGLPVIATKWDELVSIQSPAILCSTLGEFINNIQVLLKKKQEKNIYQSFAAMFDWGVLYEQLIEHISESRD